MESASLTLREKLGAFMTRREMIDNLRDMALSYRDMRSPYDTGEELHYLDEQACIEVAALLDALEEREVGPCGRC